MKDLLHSQRGGPVKYARREGNGRWNQCPPTSWDGYKDQMSHVSTTNVHRETSMKENTQPPGTGGQSAGQEGHTSDPVSQSKAPHHTGREMSTSLQTTREDVPMVQRIKAQRKVQTTPLGNISRAHGKALISFPHTHEAR